MAAVERLLVLQHNADYILVSFGITGQTLISLKMELLVCTMEGVGAVLQASLLFVGSLNEAEAPVFYL